MRMKLIMTMKIFQTNVQKHKIYSSMYPVQNLHDLRFYKKLYQLDDVFYWTNNASTCSIKDIKHKNKSGIFPNMDQNGHLLISLKRCNKMPLLWNYLTKCPCFETRFLENRVSMKNLIWWKSSNVRNFTWNLRSFFFSLISHNSFFLNQVFYWNLIFRKSSSKQRHFVK